MRGVTQSYDAGTIARWARAASAGELRATIGHPDTLPEVERAAKAELQRRGL